MPATSFTDLSSTAQVQEFYVKNILENGRMWLVHDSFAQKVGLTKGKGLTAYFKKYSAFSLALSPVAPGITPDGQPMTAASISATLLMFGDWTGVTDVASWASEDNQVLIATDLLADQYGESLDTYYRDQLAGGASVMYAGSVAARGSIVTAIAIADVRIARAVLMRAKGKFFNPLIKAGTGVGTGPIGVSYWGISHTDALVNLEALTGWKNIQDYPSQQSVMEHEAGYAANVRFCITQNGYYIRHAGGALGGTGLMSDDATNIDVYFTTIFAKNAYGIVNPEGKGNVEVITEPIGSGRASDPLHQRGTVAWKVMTVLKILNESWMCRIEHGVTAS